MNHRALVVACNLVEQGIYLRPGSDHVSLHDWIAEVARSEALYNEARSRFEELTIGDMDASTAGHAMAFEYGRAAYELGVQVGSRIRSTTKMMPNRRTEPTNRRTGSQKTRGRSS